MTTRTTDGAVIQMAHILYPAEVRRNSKVTGLWFSSDVTRLQPRYS